MAAIFATKKIFKTWAKMGYAARGVVYLDIGGLALLAALGLGGKTNDSKGAIIDIKQQPFGELLLAMLIIGLLGYVLWRLIQAIRDTDSHGTSMKGLAIRAALLISAITHTLLAVWAIQLLLGNGGNESSGNNQLLPNTTAGMILLAVVSFAFFVAGIAHIYKGWTARFERYMTIPPDKNKWAQPLCRFGLIARGIVWLILGWILTKSAFSLGQTDNTTLTDAFSWLNSSPYGNWLFGFIAAGLFAFGVYSLLEARYRRIDTQ